MIVDFSALQSKLVLEGLITQTVLPFDEESRMLERDDVCEVSFAGLLFKGYSLKVNNVSVTSLAKLSNKDIFDNGFLYKPFFIEFMQGKGIVEDDTVVKVDFELLECD